MTQTLVLNHIGLNTTDTKTIGDFYHNVLQMKLETLDDGRVIASAKDRKIVFAKAAEKGLGFGAYSADSLETLNALRKRLEDEGCNILPCVSPIYADKSAFSIVDPDGNTQCFSVQQSEESSKNSVLAGRLQHLVVTTTNITRMVDFYTKIIGFSISDKVLDDEGKVKVCFLRGDHEHHSFAIFDAGTVRLDHHCYEAVDWNLIRDWADHLVAQDVPIVWGPGRHGPGNNAFLMFNDADGNWLEISAELEHVAEDKPVGIWEHCEKTLNQWGKGLLRT
ncbi:MAG: VOC family protein [Colwellia sp.]|nr:VOC family protein [Colwellia sp.]MCW9081344.1 VOC family protein [Colwellia sp.]